MEVGLEAMGGQLDTQEALGGNGDEGNVRLAEAAARGGGRRWRWVVVAKEVNVVVG